jgi:hypothetical protein
MSMAVTSNDTNGKSWDTFNSARCSWWCSHCKIFRSLLIETHNPVFYAYIHTNANTQISKVFIDNDAVTTLNTGYCLCLQSIF